MPPASIRSRDLLSCVKTVELANLTALILAEVVGQAPSKDRPHPARSHLAYSLLRRTGLPAS
jgi:hypothetical protein